MNGNPARRNVGSAHEPDPRSCLLRHPVHIRLFVALAVASGTLLASPASGQTQAKQPDTRQEQVAPAQGSRFNNSEVDASERKPGKPEKTVAAKESRPTELESEVESLKADNAAVRELLRKMEEQQKALLEHVD